MIGIVVVIVVQELGAQHGVPSGLHFRELYKGALQEYIGSF